MTERAGTRARRHASWWIPVAVATAVALGCNGRLAFDEKSCDQDNPCPLSTLHCDLGTSMCVACTESSHCAALGNALPVCDLSTKRCVACETDSDCGAGRACNHERCVTLCQGEGPNAACPTTAPSCEDDLGFCVQCDENATPCAAASSPGPICNMPTGMCVSCLSDADCSGATPRCDTVAGRCVGCLDSTDCNAAATPLCDPTNHRCVAPG